MNDIINTKKGIAIPPPTLSRAQFDAMNALRLQNGRRVSWGDVLRRAIEHAQKTGITSQPGHEGTLEGGSEKAPSFLVDQAMSDWLNSESFRLDITRSRVIRLAVESFLAAQKCAESGIETVPDTITE